MPIVQFSRQFWYPNGALAANIPARIFPFASNALATLYTDATGTVQAPNPVTTDINGNVTFWAELDTYWLHIDSETFGIAVGMSQEASDQSTGIAFGGEFTPSATPAALDIAPLVGYIVAHPMDGSPAQVTRVTSPQRTEPLAGSSLTRALTWWVMDAAGVVTQQADRPTPQQRRTHLVLGLTAFDGVSTLVFDQTLPVLLPQPLNQLVDLMHALGPFSVSGNRISAVPGTLSFNKTVGTVFAQSFNHIPDPANPHISTLIAQTPAVFSYNTQTAFSEGPQSPFLDPANYDVAGVVTPVPNPTDVTIQRIWGYPLNDSNQQVRVQYGQEIFPSLAAAVDAIGNIEFIPNPEADPFSALLAHVVLRADATNLADITQARIIKAGKFDAP